jgi:hypothetical protein
MLEEIKRTTKVYKLHMKYTSRAPKKMIFRYGRIQYVLQFV